MKDLYVVKCFSVSDSSFTKWNGEICITDKLNSKTRLYIYIESDFFFLVLHLASNEHDSKPGFIKLFP